MFNKIVYFVRFVNMEQLINFFLPNINCHQGLLCDSVITVMDSFQTYILNEVLS